MRNRTWLVLLLVLGLVLAACGGDDGESTTTEAESSDTTEAPSDGETTTTEGGDTGTTMAPAESTGYTELDQAMAGEFEGTSVEIWAQWLPESVEAANFDATLQPFRDATGIDVNFQPTPDYETALQVAVDGGNAPDLAQIAQPGRMHQYADAGSLVALDFFNTDKLSADMVPAYFDLGHYNDTLYGIYYKTDVKSIVWYPVQAFADNGYEVPTTWDELIALSDQIIADGNGNPWCISIESQEADGWVATDWMEDILLRTAPPEVYDQWIAHEIPFNHPEVLEAADYMSDVWFAEDYAYGGSTYINATWIGETQDPMFAEEGPQCWMQKQAAWIGGFWGANRDFIAENPDAPQEDWPNVPGEDVDFFYFPVIEEEFGTPVLGAADMIVMFNDRPEVRAFLEWLATPEAAEGWIAAGGFLSPLTTVPAEWYPYPNAGLSEMVQNATTVGFDASDLMPAEVGGGTFWSGMIDWVAADGQNTEEVFQSIEDSWPG